MDSYDAAVEDALERGEDPEEYLQSLDERGKREAEHVIAMQQQANAIMAVMCGLTEEPDDAEDEIDDEEEEPEEKDKLQATLRRHFETFYKTAVAILFLFVFAVVAQADSITLSGIKHQPGETFDYTFTVDQSTGLNPDGSLFIEDILNGSVLTHDGQLGCKPCSTIYINDIFEFLPTETVTLAQFGNWNLIGFASGVSLVDPVRTPEPMTIVLIVVGGIYFWALSVKPRKSAPVTSEYLANHPFGK